MFLFLLHFVHYMIVKIKVSSFDNFTRRLHYYINEQGPTGLRPSVHSYSRFVVYCSLSLVSYDGH